MAAPQPHPPSGWKMRKSPAPHWWKPAKGLARPLLPFESGNPERGRFNWYFTGHQGAFWLTRFTSARLPPKRSTTVFKIGWMGDKKRMDWNCCRRGCTRPFIDRDTFDLYRESQEPETPGRMGQFQPVCRSGEVRTVRGSTLLNIRAPTKGQQRINTCFPLQQLRSGLTVPSTASSMIRFYNVVLEQIRAWREKALAD